MHGWGEDHRSSCHLHVLLPFCGCLWEGFVFPEGQPELCWMNPVWNCAPNLATLVLANTCRKCCKTDLKQPKKGEILLCTAGSSLVERAGTPWNWLPKAVVETKSSSCLQRQGWLLGSLSPLRISGMSRGMVCRKCLGSGFCLSNSSLCHSWRDKAKLKGALARPTGHFTHPFGGSERLNICGFPRQRVELWDSQALQFSFCVLGSVKHVAEQDLPTCLKGRCSQVPNWEFTRDCRSYSSSFAGGGPGVLPAGQRESDPQ